MAAATATSKRGRKRGEHDEFVRDGFIATVPQGRELRDLTKYDETGCLWYTNCPNPNHGLYKQVQTIARRKKSRDCRVCADQWHGRSSYEVLLYRVLDEMPEIGLYAVESHVLQGVGTDCKSAQVSLRRHGVDVWLVGLGKVIIELDGAQHTDRPIHGEDRATRASKDAAVDAAAVKEGWWVIRITPGKGIWLQKAKEAILAVAKEAKGGGSPRVVEVYG